LGHVSSPFA